MRSRALFHGPLTDETKPLIADYYGSIQIAQGREEEIFKTYLEKTETITMFNESSLSVWHKSRV